MSSMSEQLHTNSASFKPVPANPPSLSKYSRRFASATRVASIESKPLMTVRRGKRAAYLSLRCENHSMVYCTICSMSWRRRAISSSRAASRSTDLSALNFNIRPMRISHSRIISSRVTVR